MQFLRLGISSAIVAVQLLLPILFLLNAAPVAKAQALNREEKIQRAMAIIALYPKDTAQVQIDLGKPVKANSMVGFVHAINDKQPPDDLIAPLQPRTWRTGKLAKTIYPRTKKFGSNFVIVLSDLWGYPGQTKARWRAPYHNFEQWENFVRSTVKATQGEPITFEIWNEPDGKEFWIGSKSQWLETCTRAARIITAESHGQAKIAGPSLAHFDSLRLKQYVDHFRSNNLPLDILTWHEFRSDLLLPTMQSEIADLKLYFDQSCKFKSKAGQIFITEYLPEAAQFRPASNLAYLVYLENSKVDGACRACWNESAGSNCWNCSLEGLLAVNQGKYLPRSVWWIYKYYADGVTARVKSTTDDPRVVCVAAKGCTANTAANLLIGYCGESLICPEKKVITVTITNLPKASNRRFEVRRIPSMGEQPIKEPSIILTKPMPSNTTDCTIVLPALKLFEAYQVQVLND